MNKRDAQRLLDARARVLAATIEVVESPLIDMVETADVEAFRRDATFAGETYGDVIRRIAALLPRAARGDVDMPDVVLPRVVNGPTGQVLVALSYLTEAVRDTRAEAYASLGHAPLLALESVSLAREAVREALEMIGESNAHEIERQTWRESLSQAREELCR